MIPMISQFFIPNLTKSTTGHISVYSPFFSNIAQNKEIHTISKKWWPEKPNSTHIEQHHSSMVCIHEIETKPNNIHTFAIRLALRYLIMRSHAAINAMPNNIPIKIPEISPIFPDSKHHLPCQHKHKKYKPKSQNQKLPTWKRTQIQDSNIQVKLKVEPLCEIWEKNLKGSSFGGRRPIGVKISEERPKDETKGKPKFLSVSLFMQWAVGLCVCVCVFPKTVKKKKNFSLFITSFSVLRVYLIFLHRISDKALKAM